MKIKPQRLQLRLDKFKPCIKSIMWKVLLFVVFPFITSCGVNKPSSAPQSPVQLPPIRFLLTFDDGPSGARQNNPTEKILKTLAGNSIQPDIKAIFFVQTRAVRGGGTDIGQHLLRRMHDEGHLLSFHSATTHHVNHLSLAGEELDTSLQIGIADLANVTGRAPQFVRPPYWGYSANTLSSYHRAGLHMLLTDLSANDGKIHGVNWSFRKHSNLFHQLHQAKQRVAEGQLETVDGNIPIVVTFHDVNPYTARRMDVYLRILVQVANELQLPLAARPFFDDRDEIERAAMARAVKDATAAAYIPGIWGWWWGVK